MTRVDRKMPMHRRILATFFFAASSCAVSAHAQADASDPLKPLAFLEGTWEAQATGGGTTATGRYTFRRELGNHVLARHGTTTDCKGPDSYDCEHGDLLYVFQDAPGQPLKAIYLDNEGHVIHYVVTMPDTNQAVFLSEPAPGPRFRLVYRRDGATMQGRFQMQAPGEDAWRSYLEWSGGRQ